MAEDFLPFCERLMCLVRDALEALRYSGKHSPTRLPVTVPAIKKSIVSSLQNSCVNSTTVYIPQFYGHKGFHNTGRGGE